MRIFSRIKNLFSLCRQQRFFFRLNRKLKKHGLNANDLKRSISCLLDLESLSRSDVLFLEYLANGF